MSCPRWDRLVAFRYAGPDAREPEGWQEALEHLDTCSECREAAVAADPALAFRRLPEVSLGADELRSLRSGVDALRRARRVDAAGLGHAWAGPRSSRWSRGVHRLTRGVRGIAPTVGRLAAAALLAGALLSTAPDGLSIGPGADAGAQPTPQALLAQAGPWSPSPAADSVLAEDDIESPTASVYHLSDDEIGITMVVDPGLDV